MVNGKNSSIIIIGLVILAGFFFFSDNLNFLGAVIDPNNPTLSNFESGLGIWNNALTGDDLDWRFETGTTPSIGTGPSGDHTSGFLSLGNYIYIESSGGGSPDKTSILESDILESGLPLELSFWYHMYGSDMGSLDVEVLKNNNWNNIFNLVGQQQTSLSDDWRGQILNVPFGATKIRFVGTTGSSYRSDIALDDIQISAILKPCISDNECQIDEFCDSSLSACIPGCITNSVCLNGFVCSATSHGQCVLASGGTIGCADQPNPDAFCDAIDPILIGDLKCDLTNNVCVPGPNFVACSSDQECIDNAPPEITNPDITNSRCVSGNVCSYCTRGKFNVALFCEVPVPPCTLDGQCDDGVTTTDDFCKVSTGECVSCNKGPLGEQPSFNDATGLCEYTPNLGRLMCPDVDTITGLPV